MYTSTYMYTHTHTPKFISLVHISPLNSWSTSQAHFISSLECPDRCVENELLLWSITISVITAWCYPWVFSSTHMQHHTAYQQTLSVLPSACVGVYVRWGGGEREREGMWEFTTTCHHPHSHHPGPRRHHCWLLKQSPRYLLDSILGLYDLFSR